MLRPGPDTLGPPENSGHGIEEVDFSGQEKTGQKNRSEKPVSNFPAMALELEQRLGVLFRCALDRISGPPRPMGGTPLDRAVALPDVGIHHWVVGGLPHRHHSKDSHRQQGEL